MRFPQNVKQRSTRQRPASHDPETLITLRYRRGWSRSIPQLEQRLRCKE